jgi:parvulin-like peptidyl-prolyl isomerase
MKNTDHRASQSAILTIVLAVGVAGCGSNGPQAISPQDFYAQSNPQANALPSGDLTVPDAQTSAAGSNLSGSQPVQGSIPRPTTAPDLALVAPTTHPSVVPTFGGDQYLTLGGVITAVNGRPIYADTVIRLDENVLREKAKQMGLAEFKVIARNLIERTVGTRVDDELEVAAAERTLDPKDIQFARVLTAEWSEHQVSEAGGSEQVARIRAHESGEEFQDQEKDQYDRYLQELYYFRKINPQIAVSREDEWRYYHAHIDEFTTPAQADIILIEADPAQLNGDRKAAMDKLRNIRERALAGEDFAAYARDQSDLPSSAGEGGNGGHLTIKRDTFVYTAVEAQVWKTPVGQISDVIEDHDAFFIFKLLTRDVGGTKAFADQAVQDAIYRRLFDIQRDQRRRDERQKLMLEAIIYPDPPNIGVAVEMAVQNYPRWSGAKPQSAKSE